MLALATRRYFRLLSPPLTPLFLRCSAGAFHTSRHAPKSTSVSRVLANSEPSRRSRTPQQAYVLPPKLQSENLLQINQCFPSLARSCFVQTHFPSIGCATQSGPCFPFSRFGDRNVGPGAQCLPGTSRAFASISPRPGGGNSGKKLAVRLAKVVTSPVISIAKKTGEATIAVARGTAVNSYKLVTQPSIALEWYTMAKTSLSHLANWTKKGFSLFWANLSVSLILLKKKLRGQPLTLREHKLLVRTLNDVLKMVPFSLFVIIPFAEFLLPVALTLFPNMLPSTFAEKAYDRPQLQRKLKAKQELTQFFQELVAQRTRQILDDSAKDAGLLGRAELLREFQESLKRKAESEAAGGNGEISEVDPFLSLRETLKFSKLFKEEFRIEKMSDNALQTLCKMLGFTPFRLQGRVALQLRHHLLHLQREDREILWEGVDSLTHEELVEACKDRAMRFYGISDEAMREQMRQWLELSSHKDIPPLLLIWSRSITMTHVQGRKKEAAAAAAAAAAAQAPQQPLEVASSSQQPSMPEATATPSTAASPQTPLTSPSDSTASPAASSSDLLQDAASTKITGTPAPAESSTSATPTTPPPSSAADLSSSVDRDVEELLPKLSEDLLESTRSEEEVKAEQRRLKEERLQAKLQEADRRLAELKDAAKQLEEQAAKEEEKEAAAAAAAAESANGDLLNAESPTTAANDIEVLTTQTDTFKEKPENDLTGIGTSTITPQTSIGGAATEGDRGTKEGLQREEDGQLQLDHLTGDKSSPSTSASTTSPSGEHLEELYDESALLSRVEQAQAEKEELIARSQNMRVELKLLHEVSDLQYSQVGSIIRSLSGIVENVEKNVAAEQPIPPHDLVASLQNLLKKIESEEKKVESLLEEAKRAGKDPNDDDDDEEDNSMPHSLITTGPDTHSDDSHNNRLGGGDQTNRGPASTEKPSSGAGRS